jgi:hypothetical protein
VQLAEPRRAWGILQRLRNQRGVVGSERGAHRPELPAAVPARQGWVLVAAGGFRLVPGERYQLAVRGAGLVDEPDFISALCDGPRSFQGIEWGAVLAFRRR